MIPPENKCRRTNRASYYEPTRSQVLTHITGARNSRRIAGAAEHFPWKSAGHHGLVDDWHAVHEHIIHPLRQLVGIFESRDVVNRCRIEDDDVRAHSRLQDATVREAHALRRQGSEFADSFFQGELVFLADIFPKDAWERAVGAWVGMFAPEDALGRSTGGVVVDGDPRLLERQGNVRLGHAEDGHGSESMVFNEKVEERIHRLLVPGFCDLGKRFALQRKQLG